MSTPERTPIHDQLLAEQGPLPEPVETDYAALVARAVLALTEGVPA